MATLSTGRYHIRNMAAAAGEYVGREAAEDKSYAPKKIVTLPASQAPPTWNIDQLPNKYYRVTVGNAPTGIDNGHIYAFLQGSPAPTDWAINRIPQYGDHAYTIVNTTNIQGGWVLESVAPHNQVSFGRLVIQASGSNPPLYTKNELWEISPA